MVVYELTGQVRPLGEEALRRQTDRTLELLARHDVRATFFMLGITAATWPDIVRRIRDAGHEIGCHGHTHTRATGGAWWRAASRS